MNRRALTNFVAAATCLSIAFLTGCSSSSSPSNNTTTITITAGSGSGQTAAVGAAFASALVANVTTNGSPTSGATVTFAAPSSGASCALSSTSATTDSSGNASVTCTANSTAGAYSVTASTSGATSSASFSLTNNAAVASSNYVFYVSGQETLNGGTSFPNFYAIAGAVTIDSNGNILGGEQDYNDGFGITATDQIQAASSALGVDATTGVGTLTITTTDTNVGVNGVETFAVQFVNANHALISQFDASATSSGSFDLQTVTTPASGNYAFSIAGVDDNLPQSSYGSFAVGGVVNVSSSAMSGIYDINDANTGADLGGNPFTGATVNSTDQYGRGTVSGLPFLATTTNLVFYVVGPATGSQALRLIAMDASDVAVGSAYGQGTATFDDTSLTTGVFGLSGQNTSDYAALGMFSTDSSGTIASGTADDNELFVSNQLHGVGIAGAYDLVGSGVNGYGIFNITSGNLGDVTLTGLYMVDPALNINDPNNTTTDVGGALLVDLDSVLAGGTGVITPQPSTLGNFNGNYAAGFQDQNEFNSACSVNIPVCELDMVGPFSMTSGTLSTAAIGADVSDPFGTITGAPSFTEGNSFSSVPAAVSAGYYSASPLAGTIDGLTGSFPSVDIYQATGTTLYWLDFDPGSVFLGPIEAQGSLTGMPAVRKPASKPQATHNSNTKSTRGSGWHVR